MSLIKEVAITVVRYASAKLGEPIEDGNTIAMRAHLIQILAVRQRDNFRPAGYQSGKQLIDQQRTQIEALKNEMEAAVGHVSQLCRQRDELREKLSAVEADRDRFFKDGEEFIRGAAEIKRQNETLQSEIASLEKILKNSFEENHELKDRVTNLNKEIVTNAEAAKSQIDLLFEQKNEMLRELEEWRKGTTPLPDPRDELEAILKGANNAS